MSFQLLDLSAYLAEVERNIRWVHCPQCGTEVAGLMGRVCWDCFHGAKREREAENRIATACESIPREYQWARFTAPELPLRIADARQIEHARKAVAERRVVIQGNSGAGKTSLAAAMFRDWHTQHEGRGVFAQAMFLAAFVLQDELKAADLVVLDDLGAEKDLQSNVIPELVYERHANGKALWVTTGLSDDQLSNRYGAGVSRRLLERATRVRFGGKR